MVRKSSASTLAVVPKAVLAMPLKAVRPRQAVAAWLRLETLLPKHVTGKRGGRRAPWVERRFKARLRGRIIKMKTFRLVFEWTKNDECTPYQRKKKNCLQLAKTHGSDPKPPPIRTPFVRKTKNSLKSAYVETTDGKKKDHVVGGPLRLMPSLSLVVPDCVLEKIRSKKRLNADAKMALETFGEEAAARQKAIVPVELSEKEKEDDLSRMRGEARKGKKPKKPAQLATSRGSFSGARTMKMLKYK